MNLTLHEPVITYRTRTAPRVTLDTPEASAERFRTLFSQLSPDPTVEALVIITVNARNVEVGHRLLTLGTSRQTLVDAADTLRTALLLGGRGFIIAHNHPSGDPSPSAADVAVTRKLRAAAELVDLTMNDHIILGEASADPTGVGFYSFCRAGLI